MAPALVSWTENGVFLAELILGSIAALTRVFGRYSGPRVTVSTCRFRAFSKVSANRRHLGWSARDRSPRRINERFPVRLRAATPALVEFAKSRPVQGPAALIASGGRKNGSAGGSGGNQVQRQGRPTADPGSRVTARIETDARAGVDRECLEVAGSSVWRAGTDGVVTKLLAFLALLDNIRWVCALWS
jgi:hypothetical protein